MKEYEGAVLFVDILGIGELTSGDSIKITQADFEAICVSTNHSISNQTYCAFLLSSFRRTLAGLNTKGISVSQLSDCAFLWSEQPNLILSSARKLMWKNLRAGVLCRAGLSYGQIVQPDATNRKIGHFVCGDAVTRAAHLETRGKGARIFVDTKLPVLSGLQYTPSEFSALKNASDYQEIDEYRWFSYHPRSSGAHAKRGAKNAVNNILNIIGLLRHSPLYRWNASTPSGRLQVGCTIERLSVEIQHLDNKYSLDLGPDYYWENEYSDGLPDHPRSAAAFESFIDLVSLHQSKNTFI